MIEINDKVTFFDADPAGIMFFANAFRFAHKAYEEFLADSSLTRNYFADDDFVIPIIKSEANFFSPIKPQSEIKIVLHVEKIKTSSFELNYDIFNNGLLSVNLKTVHVVVLKNDFEKTEIPGELFNLLSAHLNR